MKEVSRECLWNPSKADSGSSRKDSSNTGRKVSTTRPRETEGFPGVGARVGIKSCRGSIKYPTGTSRETTTEINIAPNLRKILTYRQYGPSGTPGILW